MDGVIRWKILDCVVWICLYMRKSQFFKFLELELGRDKDRKCVFGNIVRI